MRRFLIGCAVCLIASAFASPSPAGEKVSKKVPPALNFKMESIDGKSVDLAKYRGKVVLFVNVASECGFTPQYKGLQALHEKYGKDGLVIVGIPCNDFGKQEPGANEKIKEFCTAKYKVTFDMLAKVDILGEKPAPLYKFLQSRETNPNHAGPVQWNFEKFLIGRDGSIVARFASDVEPDADDLLKQVQTELKK